MNIYIQKSKNRPEKALSIILKFNKKIMNKAIFRPGAAQETEKEAKKSISRQVNKINWLQ